jgi:short-subunit dehydrogenase
MRSLIEVQNTISKMTDCKVEIYQLEMSDLKSINSFSSKIIDIDLLINNAAYYMKASVKDTSSEDFYKIHDANYLGSVLLTSNLLKKGKIKKVINILSTSAIAGRKNHSAYSSTKSAFWAYTRSLRRVSGNEVQVLEVFPSTFKSELFNRNGKHKSQQRGLSSLQVAARIIKSEKLGKEKLFVPFKAKLYYLLEATAYTVFRRIFL